MLFSSLPNGSIDAGADAQARPSLLAARPTGIALVAVAAVFGILLVDRVVMAGALGDSIAISIAWILNIVTGFLGQLLLIFVSVLVSVAQYDGFVRAAPVANGWTIVRDITNMFFIVVLLMLAFGTILGVKNYSWNNNNALVRLLIMAVVVNFSRTICGLLIDVSTVAMMSFVYGFRDAAGGNFADALRITQVMQARQDIPDAPGVQAVNAWSVAVAMLLAFFMVLISLGVVVTMTITLVIRIVYLWLLIVISPLAFLMKAVPGGVASGYYGKWWKMFTSQVIVGPVMAFFLWLSLVSVAGNNLTSQFKTGSSSETISGPISQAFQNTEIQAFVIAICLLMAGQKLAKEISSESAGAATSVYEGLKKRGRKVAGYAGRGALGVAGGVATATGAATAGRQLADWTLSKATNLPLVGTVAGRNLSKRRKERGELGKKDSAYVTGLSMQERANLRAKAEAPSFIGESDERKAFRKELIRANLKDKEYAKNLKTPEQRAQYLADRAEMEKLGKELNDKTIEADIKEFEKKRPDLIVDPTEKDYDKLKKQRELLKKTASGMSRGQIEDLDAAAFTPEVIATLNPQAVLSARDVIRGKVPAMSEEQGARVTAMLDAIDAEEVRLEGDRDDEGRVKHGDKAIAKMMREYVNDRQFDFVADSGQLERLTDADRAKAIDMSLKRGGDVPKMSDASLVGAMTGAITSAAGLQPGTDLDRLNANLDRMGRALEQRDLNAVPASAREELRKAMTENTNVFAPMAVLASGGSAQQAFRGYNGGEGGFGDPLSRAAYEGYVSRGKNAQQLASMLPADALNERAGVNEITTKLVMNLDADAITDLKNSSKPENADALIAGMENMKKAEVAAFQAMNDQQVAALKSKVDTILDTLKRKGGGGGNRRWNRNSGGRP